MNKQKVIQGKYPDVPSHFSQNIPNLLNSMLQKDPSKRPNINQILKYPIIHDRIQKLLNEEDFRDEFWSCSKMRVGKICNGIVCS